jgi:pimeloyl-ACP methyl ester carboxylesterase
LAKACLEYDAFAGLEKLKCPTLVLGAELDQVLGVIASREIAEVLKQNGVPTELYVYENYGHAAYDEAPDYRARILEFLKG